jgi:hypothetical protein
MVAGVTVWRRAVVGPVGAGLVLLAGGVASAAGWIDRSAVAGWAGRHAGWLVVFGLAGALISTGFMSAARRAPTRRAVPALSWWVVAAAAAVVAAVAWGATAALLREADQAKDPAAARVEAIKTGLTIGAGTGGVFALLLAVRRQWHQELSSAATELDAAQKRVTELYTKAADQLGADKAPVRLAGLYALERLAQDNPAQRQTIVNVLCAYLRMPYQPPGDPPADSADEPDRTRYRERIQEREVRLTAQRLLADHLRPGDSRNPVATFWRDPEQHPMDLDLTGAVLINFSLTECRLRTATFNRAQFIGDAQFGGAAFTGDAAFNGAEFAGHAGFIAAECAGHAEFHAAKFASTAAFNTAQFASSAAFREARFADAALFTHAVFASTASFDRAAFAGLVSFDRVTFAVDAGFVGAEFTDGMPAVLQTR